MTRPKFSSFVRNCLLIPRADAVEGPLFFRGPDGAMCARLDGYAVLPVEDYLALLPPNSLYTAPPEPSAKV